MEEIRTINLDKYDYRLILNALNEFRNIKIQENVDIEIIDRLMSKLLKAPINKKMLSLNRHTNGKLYYIKYFGTKRRSKIDERRK